ncbi:MAG: dihydrolipoyl dehydrogenase [Chitinophagales bacterium]|nr:dihydrolipoyl dehydrogenase [Chitinophagales bacterium]
MEKFDVIVIGSGPGGYVAAIRAAQLGKKTAIIEKYSTMGGTCLNVGCIPSKALLDSSEHYYNITKSVADHGIIVGDVKFDFSRMIERKGEVVKANTTGIEFLMKKNKITAYQGVASFENSNTLQIALSSGEKISIQGDNIIIATGSKPSSLPFIKIDKKRIITSTEALSLKEQPKSLIVIGGGVIGLELGSVYSRLGTEVTVIEYLDRIIPGMDDDLSKELQRVLKKQGIKFNLSHKVSEVKADKNKVVVKALNKKDEEISFEADYCLVAVGRKPYTEGLGLDKIGIEVNKLGQIPVNEHLETSVKGVYAIGDVIKGAMLAHKAEEEGVFVAETIAGQKPHIHYKLIPGVVYTWPEVAGVGYTERELKDAGREYKSGSFPFRALGRSRASGDIDGLVKVIADKSTDEILGVHIIGARAADLIAEGVVAMEYRASAEDIARMSHAHPTYSEAIKEACLAATDNRSIHS